MWRELFCIYTIIGIGYFKRSQGNNGSFKFAWNGIVSWCADKIIVLSDGKIFELGAHCQLVRELELYAQMWVRPSSDYGSDLDDDTVMNNRADKVF